MPDDTPDTRPVPQKVQPAQPLSEAELSRIAREAVHQPADARLDKQLARLGLMEGSEPAASLPTDPELIRLREELRRMRILVSLLVAMVAVLAVIVVVLLVH